MKRNISEVALANEYYHWLCDLIKVNQDRQSYWFLTKALHSKDFYWMVPNDDNRAFDGRALREQFCNETGGRYPLQGRECTMLEVMIGLAYRCEGIMADQIDGNMPMHRWFWRILSNVGLTKFTDENYYLVATRPSVAVDIILNNIINRRYKRNGDGGLFPLKKPKHDQRKVELWYQMCEYLVENYYTEGLEV